MLRCEINAFMNYAPFSCLIQCIYSIQGTNVEFALKIATVIPSLTIITHGIQRLLNNINPHKASGPDNISGRILKDLQNFTALILIIIFQKSLQIGCILSDWKHANVAPAYKKGEKYNAVNYKPISLTCISCKIMEHVITKHILNHLESNSLLYDLQHGFRHSRSCETQLLSFVQELAANY